ncbi:guanine nucleotide exchange factor VAV3 [Cricetulus griseus]|nr:guanine nucleotide exchange factor VAV3 [Cricetulus griseus]
MNWFQIGFAKVYRNTKYQALLWFYCKEQSKSGGVIETLSRLSRTPIALATGIRPFPTEESVNDEDIYKGLPDLIDETRVEDEEDLYDCVYGEDEGGEVYEDLMKAEEAQQPVGLLLVFKVTLSSFYRR